MAGAPDPLAKDQTARPERALRYGRDLSPRRNSIHNTVVADPVSPDEILRGYGCAVENAK
jgi:hypothetical protein